MLKKLNPSRLGFHDRSTGWRWIKIVYKMINQRIGRITGVINKPNKMQRQKSTRATAEIITGNSIHAMYPMCHPNSIGIQLRVL
ncbi:hypothetical protein C0J52_01816 [Blattella germanica]|nr:hypothetical protein C0J52_01816 [Blattella germanica]